MERRFGSSRFQRGGERRSFGPRRDFEKRDFEKPVNVGETYDVEITEVGSRGDGIARVKNFVVFVANTKKGEKCKIKITQVARRFAIGEKTSEKSKEKAVEEEAEEVDEEESEEEEEAEEVDEEESEEVGEEESED
jgi:predicted RNA-binding protein with TRAM domain